MEKKWILVVGVIGLLLSTVLILAGCGSDGCSGNGNCTVTIGQGSSGLYIDNEEPRSTCGKSATWNSDLGEYTGGCKTQNNIDGRNRSYGTHGCSC